MAILTTILIIDDEEDFCSLLSISLRRELSYEITCVHCLADAHLKLKSSRPAVILLDHNLPDGTGLDFFIEKKDLFVFSHVILMTADPSPHLKIKASQVGIHFLSKPFELQKIKELIKMAA